MKNYTLLFLTCAALVGCSREADIASHNLSQAADDFQVMRRIVFYNGVTGEYVLSIEGLCSLGNQDKARELSVTCKTGPSEYKKHFLGLSDNVTYFAEQLGSTSVNSYQYKVVFKPLSIAPDVEVKK
jgi:hypothetical protein